MNTNKKNDSEYTPSLHETGWSIAIETPGGVIGLWSCWLENQFYLGYPGSDWGASTIDDLVKTRLKVRDSHAVLQVNCTAVHPGYEGEFKDPDKPLEVSEAGQTVAYQTVGYRRWAKFFSNRLDKDEGRVWVDHSNFCSESHYFPVVTSSTVDGYIEIQYGHARGWGVYNVPFTFANRYAPDGPSAKHEHVQLYRESFLGLACAIASTFGGVLAVNVKYDFTTLTPALLVETGYTDIRWIKGTPEHYQGWGGDVVLARKDNEHVLLKSGNSLVPWLTIRRVPVEYGILNVPDLLSLLCF